MQSIYGSDSKISMALRSSFWNSFPLNTFDSMDRCDGPNDFPWGFLGSFNQVTRTGWIPRLWWLWMLLKILIAEKYLSILFQHLTFFLGEQCAPQRQMVGYFLSKNLSIIVHHIRQIYQIWSNLSCWGSRWHQAVVLILWILVKKTKFTRWDSEYYRQDGANKNHGWDHHKHVQWSKVYRGLWRKNWATKTWNAAWKQMWSSGIYYI